MWFVFAALTFILAKVGIDGVNSNLATAIRTLVLSWAMLHEKFTAKSWLGCQLIGADIGTVNMTIL